MSRTPIKESIREMLPKSTSFQNDANGANGANDANGANQTPSKKMKTVLIDNSFSDEIDIERAETVAGFTVIDSSFRQRMIEKLRPALEKDLDSVVRGRYVWRHVSEFSEVFSKMSSLTATILAFASSSELTDDDSTRILAFSAGVVGSVAMVSNIFSNFARSQALERSKALATIVQSAKIENIPDVTESIGVQTE